MNPKRIIYLLAFTFLGLITTTLIHGSAEIIIIRLLIQDFETYGLGLDWAAWFTIHDASSIALAIIGIATGFFQGRYWWRRIYVEQALSRYGLTAKPTF